MNQKEIMEFININNIGEVEEINRINEGVINDNFIVKTNKGKFFIKKYSNNLADSKIEYIKEIENFMSDNDIPAIKSVINDKEHKISIYPFIESNRSHDYNEKDYFLIGQMLAKIHKASFNIDLPKELKQFGFENKSTENNSSKTTKYIEDINSKHSPSEIDLIYKEYLEKKLKYSKIFEYEQELQNDVIIHGDYHPANLFFNKDKTEIIGICDWEKAGYAPRTYDFAKSYSSATQIFNTPVAAKKPARIIKMLAGKKEPMIIRVSIKDIENIVIYDQNGLIELINSEKVSKK